MPPKRDLGKLIADSQPAELQINRGQGFNLSVHSPDAEIAPAPASAPTPPPAPPKPIIYRESAKVDKELIRKYKKIAVDQDRNLYEVMEEALRYWLDFHNSTKE